ncbi:uncharacterized protein [Watersipora subatra]|uniref:uncharacterized protein n=1 Tax=Watersipora subatra TaxID=2589382 RepID=UPI00355C33F3
MSDCKSVATPFATDIQLVKDDGSKSADHTLYQSIVGSLLYASTATRPDITHSVGVLSKFNSMPTQTHLTAAKRVLRYLKGTMGYGITFNKTDTQPVGYSNANWAENDESRHSISGNVFMSSSGSISWFSKRQSTIAVFNRSRVYRSFRSCKRGSLATAIIR